MPEAVALGRCHPKEPNGAFARPHRRGTLCTRHRASRGAMHIHEIETNCADAIEAGLAEARRLEGRFILEEWAPGRYHLLPGFGDRDGFIALCSVYTPAGIKISDGPFTARLLPRPIAHAMPRYFFHVFEGTWSCDEEGDEF